MKKILATFLFSLGLVAFVGCAEQETEMSRPESTAAPSKAQLAPDANSATPGVEENAI